MVAERGVDKEAIRLWVKDVKPRQVMEILKFNHIRYDFDPATKFLYVMLDGEFLEREFGAQKKAEFNVKHADVMDMEQAELSKERDQLFQEATELMKIFAAILRKSEAAG